MKGQSSLIYHMYRWPMKIIEIQLKKMEQQIKQTVQKIQMIQITVRIQR